MQRSLVLSVLVGMIVAGLAGLTSETRAGEKDKPAVREIKVVGYPVEPKSGSWSKPMVIDSDKTLEKLIAEQKTRDQIKSQVDFQKEQVLLFAWSGSGQDRITYDIKEGKEKVDITFAYLAGATDDLKHHVRVFALPKTAGWKVVEGKGK